MPFLHVSETLPHFVEKCFFKTLALVVWGLSIFSISVKILSSIAACPGFFLSDSLFYIFLLCYVSTFHFSVEACVFYDCFFLCQIGKELSSGCHRCSNSYKVLIPASVLITRAIAIVWWLSVSVSVASSLYLHVGLVQTSKTKDLNLWVQCTIYFPYKEKCRSHRERETTFIC